MQQDPRNLIIFSDGVTFIRMPENLKSIDYESLAMNKAPDDLSDYFRGEMRLPEDERHNWANFWGIHRLWMVHKHLDPKFKDIEVESIYCQELKEKVNSYNGILLRYLYNCKDTNIGRTLNEQAESINQHLANNIKPIINQIDDIIDDISKTNEDDKLGIIDSKLVEIKKILNLNDDHPLNEIISSITVDSFEQENQEMISNLKNEILDYLNVQQFKTIDDHRRELKEKNPSIIYIDDQANLGWADVFQEIIYGGKSSNFNVLIPKSDDTIDFINDKITKKITELIEKLEPPQLIIVDMRLKGEPGFIKIEEISGVQVLNYILQNYIKIPVIVVTASNKFRLYIHLKDKKHSPRGFWIKEGIDNRYTEKDSVNNYSDLVYQLNNLIKKKSDYRRREYEANTVKNTERKDLAVKKMLSSATPHYYSEREIEIIVKSSLFEKIKHKIVFNNIIIDTNYFCAPNDSYKLKNNNEIVLNLQLFILLASIYKYYDHKIIIPHKVYGELFRHGMTLTNYANPNVASRLSFQVLKNIYKEDKFFIDCETGFEKKSLPDILTTTSTYADPDIIELFISYAYSNTKNIALISDDYDLKKNIINELNIKKYLNIFKSSHINELLIPLMEYGETLYENISDDK